jgi:superfamily I DNA and/or RNA helicase/ssDNA-binding Zn-finger/Zn-ribbon topoisomerase 1
VFRVDSALNLPDDSPGDLHVAGRVARPLETTIVAINGLEITLSVGEDLGDYVPRATLQSNLTHLLRTLIQRVEGFAERVNPAGQRLLGEVEAQGELPDRRIESLNERQAEAVASALARDTTFIWGPPGTGKTRTIGKIGEQLVRAGRSVLVVSHTNTAVDQALLEIATDLGDDLVDGSVLRLGEPRDQRLLENERLQAETHIRERSRELLDRKAALEAERSEKNSRLTEVRRLIGIAEWSAQAQSELASLWELLDERRAGETSADDARAHASALQESVKVQRDRAKRARELESRVKEALPVREELARRQALLAPAEARLHEAERFAREADRLYEEITGMNGVVRRLRGLPKLSEQGRIVSERRAAQTAARDERDQVVERLAEVRGPLLELEEQVKEFEAELEMSLDAILLSAREAEDAALRAQDEATTRMAKAETLARRFESTLEARLIQLREWRLTRVGSDVDAERALAAIEEARTHVAAVLGDETPAALRAELRRLADELRAIAAELEQIEEALAAVETYVIGEATVVATTLTRAYKRESIQARRFDTVVLDEASMAPIPALWVVAGLADANVVVVGDPMQLPPIKHSEHELADKWLGQDVFRVSGVQGASEAGQPPEHLVQLQVQYRMHPQISAIPNELVYDHSLVDDEGVADDSALDDWYQRDWGRDAPVLLVDMAPLNAWVTSVKTGRAGGSRLNFLSATVSVDVAERLLRLDRPKLPLGERPRVLIAAPYRPQARLVNLLIQDAGLEREVAPGTAHTFQGSEAPVVIFDFVLDEPHRQAGLFDPKRNEDNRRLLNVALTRARRRLILLGDFSWIERHANRQASLRELVVFLKEQYPLVSAIDVVADGLHARAAEAHKLIVSGEDAPSAHRIVVTQEHFFPLLIRDVDAAKQRVVIYSPFMTPDRVAVLEPHLRAATDRGVGVYLVTKTLEERPAGQHETSRGIESALGRWGVIVLHKFHMHEKLVFVDEDTLWSGSLNSLSFVDTQEVMERRVSPDVLADYARLLRLEALLEAHTRREDRCPVCGGELVAAEARNGDPFYWRCLVPDCYTRSLDRPAPRDGLLPCASCGEPVEFRQMPSGAHWRCTRNIRHRQRVAPSHLRLPKMRALIPARDLARLEREFAHTHTPGEQLGLLG